jgi:BirA family biotin operon repressor/biotin-[acetyl-CoA-carboxylase] ligase
MALTCVVLPASQTIKKSATASGILRRSRDMIFSPFFSCIAWIMALIIFEFFANRTDLLGFRLTSIDNCSNNQNILNDELRKCCFQLSQGLLHSHLPKNSNLLPDHGEENPARTTFDNQLIELESVDSTNNYAMARIHEGMATDGLVYIARHQWAGKGQRGKTWKSEPGQNLMMSLVIEPFPLILTQQFLFSAAVALAILDLVNGFHDKNWKIKWPNDIYWSDRKAGGLLVESIITGQTWRWAVVGIGLNLNQTSFPGDIPNPVSLNQITGSNYEPLVVARELVPKIQDQISILHKNPDQIFIAINDALYKRDQVISIRKNGELLVTTLRSVDSNGSLITENGTFILGEVEFIQGH